MKDEFDNTAFTDNLQERSNVGVSQVAMSVSCKKGLCVTPHPPIQAPVLFPWD